MSQVKNCQCCSNCYKKYPINIFRKDLNHHGHRWLRLNKYHKLYQHYISRSHIL